MDIQAYISSGKLELFVLGDLNETEQQEVLAMAKKYPEINQEILAIEDAMLAIDQASAVSPSPKLKDKIFDTLESEDKAPIPLSSEEAKASSEKASNIKAVSTSNPWKTFAVAASVVAVISVSTAIYYANQYFAVEQRFAIALQQNAVLAEEMQTNQVQLKELNSGMEKFISGDFEKILMKGEDFPMQKDAAVDVFWDKDSKEVLLSVNQLASLDPTNDYQLWAIGEEGPIGIGLVDPGKKFDLQIMDIASDAQAFAITIEPKGGSESPTLEKLVVLGEVS
ncbi:anti-sigma factor [Cyclobacterium sp. 1_MG-2023]|uniref:anti-sigma factor n=1 Tax=Cyclobacterium sp. 1_MG-2023 TaxID=3062681 RepID=UPI0026E37BED|nr:anti-sigma factor [Cyclobacterium sp. 1_MG-2023]MDO6437188.1 anti-sigma factor [Cyclobacterium sp. 1_MG-2023]